MALPEDQITIQHAQFLSHEFKLGTLATKCERTIRTQDDVCTMWLANTEGTARLLIMYHADDMPDP